MTRWTPRAPGSARCSSRAASSSPACCRRCVRCACTRGGSGARRPSPSGRCGSASSCRPTRRRAGMKACGCSSPTATSPWSPWRASTRRWWSSLARASSPSRASVPSTRGEMAPFRARAPSPRPSAASMRAASSARRGASTSGPRRGSACSRATSASPSWATPCATWSTTARSCTPSTTRPRPAWSGTSWAATGALGSSSTTSATRSGRAPTASRPTPSSTSATAERAAACWCARRAFCSRATAPPLASMATPLTRPGLPPSWPRPGSGPARSAGGWTCRWCTSKASCRPPRPGSSISTATTPPRGPRRPPSS